nr:hypothetical protein [uncultured Mediterranean phage uvMED]
MTIAPMPYDSVESDLTQASRYLARAATELRERGDHAFATLITHYMHSLYRPEYLKAPAKEPVLPALPSRFRF